jgi:DNA-binding response OmpR family regulator
MREITALIIEDDQDISFLFSQALGAAGFKCEVALTGDEALERLAVTRPDVVVLDLHLPRVTGTDILRQIRADERLRKTRVLVTTAHPSMAKTIGDEADLVMLKPVGFRQIRSLVSTLMKDLGIEEEGEEEENPNPDSD